LRHIVALLSDLGLSYDIDYPLCPSPGAHYNPLRYIDKLGYGPDDYYVFVYGCASGCGDQRYGWYEYHLLLRMMFDMGGWGKNWKGSGKDITFEQWAYDPTYGEHLRYVRADDPVSGAKNLINTLAGIPNDGGKIHLLGHSYGGSAILYYLQWTMFNERYPVRGVSGPRFDDRIESIALIDAPVSITDFVHNRSPHSLGSWLKQKGVKVLIVDVPDDRFGGCIRDVRCETSPNYNENIYGKRRTGSDVPPPPTPFWEFTAWNGSTAQRWHSYTYTYMATQTRDFLLDAWK
jgi:pimeloyl-ACP methyl ester carboxylesterase